MKINAAVYPDFVRNAFITWRKGYDSIDLVAKQLYDVSENNLLNTEVSSLDNFTFAREVDEGDDFFEENPSQNYNKTMVKYRVALKATITWHMRKYDKYREIKRALMTLGSAASQRMELDLTHRFTFANNTAYTNMDGRSVATVVGDGLALASTAHTVTESSTTFRTRIVNNPAFSRSGLEAGEKLFATQMIDSNGKKVVNKPDTIVSTNDPATENTIREFLKSTASPTVSNSGVVNVYEAKYRHISLPYLATDNKGDQDSTKEKMWFLMNLAHTDAILEISEMPHMLAPSPGGNGEDFDNDDWKFKASAAYGIEISDPKFCVLSLGDGTA